MISPNNEVLIIKKRADQKGMTLLETMAAMTVILVVLVPLTNLYLQTKQLSKSSLNETQVLYRTQGILEELKTKEFKDVTSTSNWIQTEDGQYRIMVINKNDYLKEVTVTFQYPVAVNSKEISLTMYKAKR